MQEVLTGYVGHQALARHLDSDEAAVLGASLRAANLSDGIKLNRKLGMVDGASYGIDIKLDGAVLESKDQGLLVPLHKNLPSKVRTITVAKIGCSCRRIFRKFDSIVAASELPLAIGY